MPEARPGQKTTTGLAVSLCSVALSSVLTLKVNYVDLGKKSESEEKDLY